MNPARVLPTIATRTRRSAAAAIQLVLLLLIFGLTDGNAAQPGSVDPSFNPGRGPLSVGHGEGRSVLIQPDGRILVGGTFNGVGLRNVPPLVRFHADGRLDNSFDGSSFKVRFPDAYGAQLLALQPNGQVLVVPQFVRPDADETLVRLNSDGTIDPAFNPQLAQNRGGTSIRRVLVQPDGRILVYGSFNAVNGVPRQGFARLQADGSLDHTFNPARSGSFDLLPDGKVVVGSDSVYRLNSDGNIDPTFMADVPAYDDSGVESEAGVRAVLAQPDGKILYTHVGNFYSSVLRRLNPDGSRDNTFAAYPDQFAAPQLVQRDGKIIVNGERLHADGTRDETFAAELGWTVVQQPDGKLVTASLFYRDETPAGIRRLHLDGSIDRSFAPEGGLTTIGRAKIGHAALLPDGRIAVAGPFSHFDNVRRRGLAVLHSDGSVDESFEPGDLSTPHHQYHDVAIGIARVNAQPDGKLLVSHTNGVVRVNPDGSTSYTDGIVRLHLDGTVDPSFNYTPPDKFRGATLQPDGRLLVTTAEGLVRLLADGSRDPSFHSSVPEAEVLLVEPDGRMIVRGKQAVAARLHPDGSRDTSFSGFGGAPSFDHVRAIAQQADGNYVVSRTDAVQTKTDLLFRAFNDGRRDPSFSSEIAQALHIVVDAAGIIVAGDLRQRQPYQPSPQTFGVTRLNFDGTRDASFETTRFDGGASATRVLRQSDGNLIIIGDFAQVNGRDLPGIARLVGNAPRHFANMSTRVRVGSHDAAAIGGFIIVGDEPKKVIVRGLGPSLSSSWLPTSDVAADPALELLDASGAVVATNNNWRESEAEVNATSIPPRGETESAIVATLLPGAYTAVMRDAAGRGGLALVEIYDLNPGTGSALANISTRGEIQEGENVMIGGFMVRGSESSTIVARAIGPSLAGAGVLDVVTDPSLSLYNASGEIVAANDDWKTAQRAALEALQMGSASDQEAALLVTLPPGAYTAVVSGQSGDTGVGLVEVYNVP